MQGIRKWLSVFAVFGLIHAAAWIGTDRYLTASPLAVLVVVDTSYAMKPHFPAMAEWIADYSDSQRYGRLVVGTDKATLGEYKKLKSANVLFRTAFGRIRNDALRKYDPIKVERRFLLSDGSVYPQGWEVVKFQ